MKPVLAVRHVAHEGLGTIGDALARNDVPVEIVDALAAPSPQPSPKGRWSSADFDPGMWAGLVVMGGPMNVDEVKKYPFLAEEVRWLERAVEAGLPILGVCLGAQLLAKALGARVYPNKIKEIGWYEVELLPAAGDDPLLGSLGSSTLTPALSQGEREESVTVFQWHGDTFDLPKGAQRLARSELCENQAFRYGRAAYGLQFHLEVTAEIIESWLCEGGNCGELAGLSYIDPVAIRRETPEKLPEMQRLGRVVFDRFVEMCKGRQ
jgi:GMP synthase (glutamine-hydrolysing)